jgi:hypothetical protein
MTEALHYQAAVVVNCDFGDGILEMVENGMVS